MAVKHINKQAKEESGVLLSGADAKKVFSMFVHDKDTGRNKKKKEKLRTLFTQTI